jgi:hypothetical protein
VSGHTLDRNDPALDALLLEACRARGIHSIGDLRRECHSQHASNTSAPVMRLPVPAEPYSGDGLEVAFGPDERGGVVAYVHDGAQTVSLAWDPFQVSWIGRLSDGSTLQVIPAMVVIARPNDETAPMLWRKVVM